MPALPDAEYKGIAKAICQGATDAAIRHKFRLDARTVRDARERLARTGSIFPEHGGVQEGSTFQHRRKTTAKQDKQIKPVLMKHRGDPIEWTTTKTGQTVKPPMQIHRTNIGKRQRAAGFKAYKPRHKESYKFPDRKKRVKLCKKVKNLIQRKKRPVKPEEIICFDEHGIFHVPPGKLADRQLHSGKRFVFRKTPQKKMVKDPETGQLKTKWITENPFKGELVSQKEASKAIKGGKRIHLTAAIWNGMGIAETAQALVARSKPPPAPPPRLNSNGVQVGRKRKCDQPGWEAPERKNYDGPAHAQFLAETARWVLAKMKEGGDTRKRPRLWCHQDGDGLHWTPECRAVMRKYNMHFLETDKAKMITYSPDCNPIESTFKEADRKSKEEQKKDTATTVEQTIARWKKVFEENTEMIKSSTGNWLRRCDAVIDAKGAATKY